MDKDGYNAKLVCLSRDWPEPLVVPLKFDLKLMRHDMFRDQSSLSKSTWMHFAGDNLYIGQADILGFFTIPVSEIEANIEAQKQILLAKNMMKTRRSGSCGKKYWPNTTTITTASLTRRKRKRHWMTRTLSNRNWRD